MVHLIYVRTVRLDDGDAFMLQVAWFYIKIKLEGHSVERMYLRQRCFGVSLPQ